MSTQAQINANQRNARHSTGPRTEKGKAASSRNAARHGGYAGPRAICSGVFAEDEEEVASFLEGIVASLDPRDDIERVAAESIANGYLRLRRVEAFEIASIGGAGLDRPVSPSLESGLAAYKEAVGFVEDEEDKSDAASAYQLAIHAFRALNDTLTVSSLVGSRNDQSIDRAFKRYELLRKRKL